MSPDLRAERSLFLQAAKSGNPVSKCHVLRLAAQPARSGDPDGEEASFVIGQTCAAGRAKALAQELGRQLGMPAIPWAAVAAPLPASQGVPSAGSPFPRVQEVLTVLLGACWGF